MRFRGIIVLSCLLFTIPLSLPAQRPMTLEEAIGTVVNALSLGIPPNIVMKWTGHSDYSSMKPYIDIVDDIKATSMTKFNGLI